MIPAKTETNTTIKENSIEAIVDWLDQHKQSFYIIGLTYLKNQQQMEELFYQVIIKAHKEWPRFKRETSIDMWLTSIFIHLCREFVKNRSLSESEEDDLRQEEYKALHRLNEAEKLAIVLTYIKQVSEEETAHFLQVPVEKVKEFLFSGIRLLRDELGYGPSFNGCLEQHQEYIDYLDRTMDRSKKVDFEIHIFHCQKCQEDLATFQEVMLTLVKLTNMEDSLVPSRLIENVKYRLAKQESLQQEKNNKRKKLGFVSAGAFLLIMALGFFTGIFTNLYYSWTIEDPELRAFLQEDLGEKLNLEAESNGVKMKIKSVIADDVQTLVFYEIEDTNASNQFVIDFNEGFFVENAYEIMRLDTYPRYYPPDIKSKFNNREKNLYQGKISLQPISEESGTIQLKITRLQKLIRDSSNQNKFLAYEDMEFQEGEWNFEIPVTKHPSMEYVLDQETKIEGVPVRFDKLTIAPTATILQYSLQSINQNQQKKRIEVLNFDELEVNNQKVKADLYGDSFVNSQPDVNWMALQTQFEPYLGKKPKDISVQFESVLLTVDDYKKVDLDASQEYPQTFEYAGSTISIDKVDIGKPTIVVISNHEVENRGYESLQFHIFSEDDNEMSSMDMDVEGVLVDKNGKEYDLNETPVSYEEIEQPRHFFTLQKIGLRTDNGEEVVPTRLEIYGYNTTKYLNDVVKISLEK